jgi:flagellar hook assembly protein FlgD
MTARSYLVLSKGDSTLNNGDVILYGDSAPGIQFTNVKAVVSDQVILKRSDNLVVDELDYSSNWGAENISGPNETSLERLDPDVRTNEQSNWSYSMEQGGSPGQRNSAHYVWNVNIEPSQFNPINGETCVISYYQSKSGTVSIKVYDSEYTLVKTLIDEVYKNADTHSVTWNGKNESGTEVLDICAVEIEVYNDTENRTCIHKINDETFLGVNDQWDLANVFTYDFQFSIISWFMVKPGYLTITISDEGPGGQIYSQPVKNEAFGAGHHFRRWDARNEKGLFYSADIGWSFQTTDILGNVIITKYPLQLDDIQVSPTDYINPEKSDTQYIKYSITEKADITIKIYNINGSLIKTLVNNQEKQPGNYIVEWDGKNETGEIVEDGTYTILIKATNEFNELRKSAEVAVNTL